MISKETITNFFKRLPLNRDRVYVCATTREGCEVYIPALRNEDHQRVKQALEGILCNLDEMPKEVA